MPYGTSDSFFYNFGRLSVLFPLYPKDIGLGSNGYILGMMVLLLSRSHLFPSTIEDTKISDEKMASISLMATELLFEFLLCLMFWWGIKMNLKKANPTVQENVAQNFRRHRQEILSLFGIISLSTLVIHCAINFRAIIDVLNSNDSIYFWNMLFQGLGFVLCSTFQYYWLCHFAILGDWANSELSDIIDDLSEGYLNDYEEEELQGALDEIQTRFSVSCGIHEFVSSNFQCNGIVFVVWTLAILWSYLLNPYFFQMGDFLELNTKWEYIPWPMLHILWSSFLVTQKAAKAYALLREKQERHRREENNDTDEPQPLPIDPKLPNCFAMDVNFWTSICFIIYITILSIDSHKKLTRALIDFVEGI